MKFNPLNNSLVVFSFIFLFSYLVYGNENLSKTEDIDLKLRDLYIKYNITPPGEVQQVRSEHDFSFLKKDLVSVKGQLERIQGKYSLVVFKDEFIMLLYKGTRFIKAYVIGIGMNEDGGTKLKENDNRTPEGHFWISDVHKSESWQYEGKYAYGPWFLRLKTPWKGIGIHGTDSLDVLGTRCTHGCIRTDNGSITELRKLLPLKTKVHIFRNIASLQDDSYDIPDLGDLTNRITRAGE